MNVILIEKELEINKYLEELRNKTCLIFPVPVTYNKHSCKNNISLLFVCPLDSNTAYTFVFDHADFESKLDKSTVEKILSVPSKCISIDSKKDFHLLNLKECVDFNILSYISDLEILDLESVHNNPHNLFYERNIPQQIETNVFTPVLYFLDIVKTIVQFVKESASDFTKHLHSEQYLGFYKLNQVLAQIEKSGICIDIDQFKKCFDTKFHNNDYDGFLFSEYSLFTATGRPSNKFGGINFAALSKKDDTRKSLISRFENGILIDLDFQACHPHLIASLINYEIPKGLNIYNYLGRYYFNKESLTDDELEESKKVTFRQLYGHVEEQFQNIPYFKKKIEYNNQMVEFFRKNGYIETTVFKRRLDSKNFGEENGEKMFAYLLQSYETEINLLKAGKVIDYLMNFNSKLILYTYDSLLIDFDKTDGISTLSSIKELMETDGMPVTIKAGANYKDLKKIII